MLTIYRPQSYVVPSTSDFRLAVLGRRFQASRAVATALSEMAFGRPRRDDTALLAGCVSSRIAEAAEAQS